MNGPNDNNDFIFVPYPRRARWSAVASQNHVRTNDQGEAHMTWWRNADVRRRLPSIDDNVAFIFGRVPRERQVVTPDVVFFAVQQAIQASGQGWISIDVCPLASQDETTFRVVVQFEAPLQDATAFCERCPAVIFEDCGLLLTWKRRRQAKSLQSPRRWHIRSDPRQNGAMYWPRNHQMVESASVLIARQDHHPNELAAKDIASLREAYLASTDVAVPEPNAPLTLDLRTLDMVAREGPEVTICFLRDLRRLALPPIPPQVEFDIVNVKDHYALLTDDDLDYVKRLLFLYWFPQGQAVDLRRISRTNQHVVHAFCEDGKAAPGPQHPGATIRLYVAPCMLHVTRFRVVFTTTFDSWLRFERHRSLDARETASSRIIELLRQVADAADADAGAAA